MISAVKRHVGSFVLRGLKRFYRVADRPDLSQLDVGRILTIQGLRIGDTIATLPALTALRGRWPQAELVALAHQPALEIVELSDLADVLLPWPEVGGRVRAGRRVVEALGRVDLAVIFDCTLASMIVTASVRPRASVGYDSYNRGVGLTHPVPAPGYWNRPLGKYPDGETARSQARSWRQLLQEAGIEAAPGTPRLTPRPGHLEWADAFLSEAAGRCVVALHPGAEPAYQWLPERFAAVGDALACACEAAVVITGGPSDTALADEIASHMEHRPLVAAGRTSLGQMAGLLDRASVLVAVDTSAGHIAAAVGTPVVALFGPGDPRIWAPQGQMVKVLTAHDCSCRGCKRSQCNRKGRPCMAGIAVEPVVAAARAMLGR